MTMIREPGDWQEDWCNFKPDEFRCSCCNRLEIASELIDMLQTAREALGVPLTLTSAYRCPDHNSKIKGSSRSQHLLGKAADITIQSLKPAEVFVIIEDLIDMGELLQGGVGAYDTFTHYDIRRTKARWNYAKKV